MKIGIMGAGAIGCFLGGKLVEQGTDVTFIGRSRGKAQASTYGMRLEALDGSTFELSPSGIDYQVNPAALASCDVVLCAVKSAQTAETGATLARVLSKGTLVVSMQNGLHNADILRAQMPEQSVLGGIVGFNVVAGESGLFRRATTGVLAIEQVPDPRLTELVARLRAAGFAVETPPDIRAVQWSKLMMNLSNALGALSGVPTQQVLYDAGYRRILRAVMAEAVSVLRAARIETARLGPLPLTAFPYVLGLPTPLFKMAARAQLQVDPAARSSMWQDLARNRKTEVDELNGEIVRLAASRGTRAPINQRIVELVHQAEEAANGSPNLSAPALAALMRNT